MEHQEWLRRSNASEQDGPLMAAFKFLTKISSGGAFKREETGGCFKCSSRCDLCKNFLIQYSNFKSFSTGRTCKTCLARSSKNVVYLASCIKCNLQYVGFTSTAFKVRFRSHKSVMLTN